MDKEEVRNILFRSGCVAAGFASASNIDSDTAKGLEDWVVGGNHAGMEYMVRHANLKKDPRNVLPEVRTIISLAFSFAPAEWRDRTLPEIAAYAYGDDYHDVLRTRLAPAVEDLRERLGGEWRVCIDSAPLAERYWAVKSGIGYLGRNGMLIVEGSGSMVFLAEVLTSIVIPPDMQNNGHCRNCGKCIDVCPGGALHPDGTIDCRKCLSYLTIEHKDEWTPEMQATMRTTAGRNTLFGCDRCIRICPHNLGIHPTGIDEFSLRPAYSDLTAGRLKSKEFLTPTVFSETFRKSAIKRCRLKGLARNISNLVDQ